MVMVATNVLDMRVGDLVDSSLTGREVYDEQLFRRVDIGSRDEHGGVGVAAVEEVRWAEFEIGPWAAATTEMYEAVERVLRDVYGASDVNYLEDGDDGEDTVLTIEWYVRVEATCTLGEAMRLIQQQTELRPEGPVGFHNAMNGGYMSRNAYRDVREAVAEVVANMGV